MTEPGLIDLIFDWCVQVLVVAAGWLGISYQALNVWVFVVIWPILTVALIVVVIYQRLLLQRRH